MKRSSGGCVTASGMITVLLTLVIFGIAYAARGRQMFSPGDLNGVAGGQPVGGVF